MFDFVRDNTRLMLGLLVLLIVPSFIMFGVEGYKGFNSAENAEVATVDGQKITQADWDAAHRQQSENLRRQIPNLDLALLDRPETKYEALEQLVRQRVLAAAVRQQLLSVSDQRLQREILSTPQLAALRKPDGSFDLQAYRSLLAAQGLSPEAFEASVRQDLALNQVLGVVSETAQMPASIQVQALKAIFQQRTIRLERFQAAEHLGKIAPTDAELQAYHQANGDAFRTPEQADIEFVVLDAAALKAGLVLAEEDVRKYYEENLSAYTRAEERRASHILLKLDPKAPAEDKAKVRAKAEALLAEVRKSPARFAEVARTQSQDPGSAPQGGDLDFIARGAMVKPFEDAVFAMKAGEINGPVETEFGLHLIQLNAVRGGERQPFEKVRSEIEEKVRQQLAQRRYAESAEAFSNLVYEQSDSLQGAVDRFKLRLQKGTVTRTPVPGTSGPLTNAKLLAAVFGDEALKNKRNTDAVETGPSQMVSARVLQYRPSAVQPLEAVRPLVLEKVRQEQALAKAREAGKARVAAAQANPAVMDKTGLAMTVSRAAALGLPRDLMDAILRADASKLPAVIGVDIGVNGYAVVRLEAVQSPEPTEAVKSQWATRLSQAWGSAEAALYYEALQQRLKVKIKVPKPAPSADTGAKPAA